MIISGPAPYSSKQYSELQPATSRLVKRQRMLCEKLLNDAIKLLKEEDYENASYKLYQVFEGMPKNKQLMKLVEDIETRKLLEKTKLKMLADTQKEISRELRQELFFTIDEKGHDASLTEKGCAELNPQDPEMYVLPDMLSAMSELDANKTLNSEELMNKRREIPVSYTHLTLPTKVTG